MSASTSGSADGSPTPGFYPDPSIPGYIRYWNGVAWAPGTSRPAPADGEAMPAAPAGAGAAAAPPVPSPAVRTAEAGRAETGRADAARPETGRAEAVRAEAVRAEAARPAVGRPEETGPMFLDEEPEPLPRAAAADVRPEAAAPASAPDRDDPRRPHSARPEPAAAWPADAPRRSGFGGELDRRTSWSPDGPGADERPETAPAAGPAVAREAAGYAPAARSAPDDVMWPAPADGPEAAPSAPVPAQGGGAPPAGHAAPQPVRAAEPVPEPWPAPSGGAMADYGRGADVPDARVQSAPAGGPGHHVQQGPQAQPGRPPQGLVPAQGGAAPAWSQQPAHQAAPHPEGAPAGAYGPAAPAEGVIPWKPPVDNPFLQAAQAQGKPASLGRRLGARLIDSAVLGAVVAAAAVPLWARAADHIDGKLEGAKQSGETVTVWLLDGTTGACLGIVLAVLLLAGIVYEALPTAKWGRTLGKKLCGVRVLSIEDHDKPSFGAALRRWLVYGVLGLLVVGVVNVLWCLFDRPWRQCWHDKAAHTFVAAAR
ncbi:RDD family protein [Streptomyces sp. NPDC050610]|uniref:RDD family protein n=1 Tax=Streptomyces sp. NPDC050610 TaxID=3157097 RepID=UPI0034209AEB